MLESKIIDIADKADMIVRGYAFTRKNNLIYVFNTNDGESSMIIMQDGTMIETNMDEIEQMVVKEIWKKDSKYMED